MMNVIFGPGDTDIENEVPERVIAVTVDEYVASVVIQNSQHFTDGTVLMGVMVKRIAAGYDIERVVRKRQVLSVANHKSEFPGKIHILDLFSSVVNHVVGHIDTDTGLNVRTQAQGLNEQIAGTTADIKDTKRLKSSPFTLAQFSQNTLMAGFVAEVVLTMMFLIIILGATDKRAPQGFAPIAIGLGLTLIHLIGIPVTNVSVNPARSTGPAVFVGGWAIEQLWLFWLAPILGAILAGIIYKAVAGKQTEA